MLAVVLVTISSALRSHLYHAQIFGKREYFVMQERDLNSALRVGRGHADRLNPGDRAARTVMHE